MCRELNIDCGFQELLLIAPEIRRILPVFFIFFVLLHNFHRLALILTDNNLGDSASYPHQAVEYAPELSLLLGCEGLVLLIGTGMSSCDVAPHVVRWCDHA